MAVEIAEKYADGLATLDELSMAHTNAQDADWDDEDDDYWAIYYDVPAYIRAAKMAVVYATHPDDWIPERSARCAAFSTLPETKGKFSLADAEIAIVPERAAQLLLLHDIFGNAFRLFTLHPAWPTATVVALAETIYQEKAFDRMPILADALEDAGCTNQEILGHCRGPGPHVRGCWVVDLLLGKE